MDSEPLNKLIFVYNADSGVRNALLDSVHKVLSPSTYECNLCDITYGLFSEKVNWKEFRLQFPMEMEFLHRDEFVKDYASKFGKNFTFPIVLGDHLGELEVIINTEELNQLGAAGELIDLIKKRVPIV